MERSRASNADDAVDDRADDLNPTQAGGPSKDTCARYVHHQPDAARARRQIDPVIGRDAEIRQIIDILTRRRQNNPILTGEAGVGKTAVVEGLRAADRRGRRAAAAAKVFRSASLDLGLLQAGAGVKGEFENRLKTVIEEVKKAPKPIILFIDEAHTMIGAGGAGGAERRGQSAEAGAGARRAAHDRRDHLEPNTRSTSRKTRRWRGASRS